MLTLPIKKKWFDLIKDGTKKEEYRAMTEYYETRLQNVFGFIMVNGELVRCEGLMDEIGKEPIQEIIFRNGYSADSPAIKAKCSVRIGTGRKEWGAEPGVKYFILTIHSWQQLCG